MKETRVYLRELPSGKYKILETSSKRVTEALTIKDRREAIIVKINELNNELNKIRKNCKHPVSYDEEGFPYNVRYCVVCGNKSLL